MYIHIAAFLLHWIKSIATISSIHPQHTVHQTTSSVYIGSTAIRPVMSVGYRTPIAARQSTSTSNAHRIYIFYGLFGISPFTALVDTTVNKGCHLLCELIIFIFHGFGITCHKYWRKAVYATTQSSTEASDCIIYCIICGFYSHISNYYEHKYT